MIAVESDHHLTTLDLDRFVIGDLAAGERERVESHAGRCARCGGRRSEHESRVAQFRSLVLPRELAQLERRRPLHARLWGVAIALPALTVLVLVIAHSVDVRRRDVAPPARIGIKGDGQMQVFVRRAAVTRAPAARSRPASRASRTAIDWRPAMRCDLCSTRRDCPML